MSIRNFAVLSALGFALLLSSVASATPIPGAVVWFDAGDVDGDGNSGNNPTVGNAVGTWVDKAGTVQGVQSASNVNVPQQPLYANFQNGQKALAFTSTKILSTTTNVNLGAMTYFAAWQSTGASLLLFERGANINTGGVNGEFASMTTGTSWRVKRTAADSQKDYVGNWGNTGVAMTGTFLFDGTNASQRLLVNGSGVTLSGGGNAGTSVVSAQLNIANRSTSPTLGFVGGIAELMAYDTALNTAQVNIVNNYLSAKYATPLAVALNFYDGDSNSNGDYDSQVFGIGSEADGTVTTGTYKNGLTLTEANSSLTTGEYLMAGIQIRTNALTSLDLGAVSASTRLSQLWYLDKTNPLDATLTFNLADLNSSATPGVNYTLLYRTGQSGNFTDLGSLGSFSAVVSGNDISFLVTNAFLADGYYTLGFVPPVPEPSSCVLLGLGLVGLSMRNRRRRG